MSKYQHLVPATYLSKWCIGNSETIKLKEVKTGTIKDSNIHNIMGEKYFHSITAKTVINTEEDLNLIFSCLCNYEVFYNNVKLTTVQELKNNFYVYDDWKIFFKNGTPVSKAIKNDLKQKIKVIKINDIEENWSNKYESKWRSFVENIEAIISNRKSDKIDEYLKGYLVKWIISLDWRSISSNEGLNKAFEMIDKFIPLSDIPLDIEERCISSCDNANKEMKHNYKLSVFRDFLSDTGKLYDYAKYVIKNTSVHFYVSKGKKFITSDNPSFKECRNDGIGYVMAMTPQIVIALESYKGESKYYVSEVNNEIVDKINKKIIDNCFKHIILS